MAGFSSWFSRGTPKSAPSSAAEIEPEGSLINRIIRGRVTKNVSSAKTPSAKTARVQRLVDDEEEEEEDDYDEDMTIGKVTQGDQDHRPRLLGGMQSIEAGNDDEFLTDSSGEPSDEGNAGPLDAPTALELLERLERLRKADEKKATRKQAGSEVPDDASTTSSEYSINTESDLELQDRWREEQLYLNQILNARNEYSLLPSTWKMHFLGIPLPDGLFYSKMKDESSRPRIYARSEQYEYRGAVALRKLVEVHGRIRDIRSGMSRLSKEIRHLERTIQKNEKMLDAIWEGTASQSILDDEEDVAQTQLDEDKEAIELKRRQLQELPRDLASHLIREIKGANKWAKLDGDLKKWKHRLPSNVKIMRLLDPESGTDVSSDSWIQAQMCELASEWRQKLDSYQLENKPRAPVIFGFVIFKHIVFIVTMDASDPNALCHIPCTLNMAEYNQHQWNALAIMSTVCWARDLLMKVTAGFANMNAASDSTSSSDPDA